MFSSRRSVTATICLRIGGLLLHSLAFMQAPSSNPTSSRLPPTMRLVGSGARAVRDGDEFLYRLLEVHQRRSLDTRDSGDTKRWRTATRDVSFWQATIISQFGLRGSGCREDSGQTQAWRHTVAAANRERLAPGSSELV